MIALNHCVVDRFSDRGSRKQIGRVALEVFIGHQFKSFFGFVAILAGVSVRQVTRDGVESIEQ